ncbi:MAG TPA: NADH-quinone oxidoreductase subunit C [Candidatus Hypogeohydataceae bacterium YC40]
MGERRLYIDEIRWEFPGDILSEDISTPGEVYLTIRKESLPRIANFLHEVRYSTPLLSMFGTDERQLDGTYKIYTVFQIPRIPIFIILQVHLNETELEFPSITPLMYSGSLFEREMRDMFGFIPVGNPDTRRMVLHENFPEGIYPLRKDFPYNSIPDKAEGQYMFHTIEGEGVFEIPVGPVHAGIIEPGHFRFSVAGEPIINLEIRLHYKHKGIEKLMETLDFHEGRKVAERVSGDSTVGHVTAYCQAVEKIAGIETPLLAKYNRMIALELERLYNHIADIGGISTDVAFLFGAARAGVLREKVVQLNDELTGSRFLRGLIIPGGVTKDLLPAKEKITSTLREVGEGLKELVSILLSSTSFLDRVKTTGILSKKTAEDLGVTGPAARASGIDFDVRRDAPYEAYREVEFKVPVFKEGDVFSRLCVRIDEAFESINIIEQVLRKNVGVENFQPLQTEVKTLPHHRYALGCVEGWRGPILYWIMTAHGDKLYRCKIKDPSFCNWPALSEAVLGNIVPDFPVCNKSFNLSYAGNDL